MNAATTNCRHCRTAQAAIAPTIAALVAVLEGLGWRRLVVWPRSLGGTCPRCEAAATPDERMTA